MRANRAKEVVLSQNDLSCQGWWMPKKGSKHRQELLVYFTIAPPTAHTHAVLVLVCLSSHVLLPALL